MTTTQDPRLASATAAVSEAAEAIAAAPAETWPGLVTGLLSALDVTGRLDLGAVQMALWGRRWRGDWPRADKVSK